MNNSKNYKKELVINSMFRDNYENTKPNNFTFLLPDYVKNVKSITLTDISIPKLLYNISDNLGSNSFTIYQYKLTDTISMSLSNTYYIFLPNGIYNIDNLVNLINYDLSLNGLSNEINAHYNTVTNKFYFSFNKETEHDYIFDFTPLSCDGTCVKTNNNYKLIKGSLGWILGFRETTYSTYVYNSMFLNSLTEETNNYNEVALNWIKSNLITSKTAILRYSNNIKKESLSLLKYTTCTINDSTNFIKTVVVMPTGNSNMIFLKWIIK